MSWNSKASGFCRVRSEMLLILARKQNRTGIDLAQFVVQFKDTFRYLPRSFDRRFRELKEKGCIRVVDGQFPLYVFVKFEDQVEGVSVLEKQITLF